MSSDAQISRQPTPPPLPVTRRRLLVAADLSAKAVRIPALLQGRDGRLTVFAEARQDGAGDAGRIDVLATTSVDGRSWSDPVVVAPGDSGTMGNPVPVEAASGDTVLLTTSNAASSSEAEILSGSIPPEAGRRVHVTRLSADLTRISAPVEITDQVKRPDWGWYATGPGHGVRLPSGRMVVAANHSRREGGSSRYGAHGLVSDDDGVTWRISWITEGIEGASGPNESAVDRDPADPDEVIVTMRNEHADEPATRTLARTGRGCTMLAEHRLLDGFDGPRLQVGIAAVPGARVHLLTAPSHAGARRDLALHVVEGGACRAVGLLAAGPAGYSDLAISTDSVQVLIETGDDRTHERIELITIDLPAALHAVGPLKEQHS